MNETLPGTGPPPRVMVTVTSSPLAANGACAAGQNSASTTASLGSTSRIMADTMSGAIIGFIGATTSPALAAPILIK